MADLHLPQVTKVVKFVVVFNLLLLAVDWILLYFASRPIQKLYQEIGLDAIYNIGAFNVRVRSTIVILATLAALFKFWAVKDREVTKLERVILAIVLVLLFYSTYIVVRIFFETINRI